MTGQYVDPKAGRVTFETFYAEWAARQVWEATTALAMDLAAAGVPFGQLPLAELRRSHVEQWIKQMATRGLAPGTIRTRVNNVRAVLRAAVRDRVIAHDPSDSVTLPRLRRAEAAMTLPTSDQVGAILGAADERFRALKAVFLPDGLLGLLELLSRHVAAYRPGEAPSRWMFEATPGQPPHQNTVGHQWRQACARAGVTGVTLHDLRHFYASGLIAAGCDVVTVQRALGHAKATTTLNTYAHLWPTAEDRTRRAAGDLLAGVLPILADRGRTNEGS